VSAVAEQRYNTSACTSQIMHLGTTAAPNQQTDVFARDERQSTPFSLAGPRPISIVVRPRLGDPIVLTYLDFGTGLPAWAASVLHSLSERWGVKPGWDSYDAKATDREYVVRLLNYLSALMQDTSTPPIVTPLSDGGVQAEWHRQNTDLEIVVPADHPARYYYYNAATEEEEEEDLDSNHAHLQDLIEQF
jgi:hypothetical protein